MALLMLLGVNGLWAEEGHIYFDNGANASGSLVISASKTDGKSLSYNKAYKTENSITLPNGYELPKISNGLKMEGNTEVTFTTTKVTTLTLVQSFKNGNEATGNLVKLNGTVLTNRIDDDENHIAIYTETLDPGNYKITRVSEYGLLYVGVVPVVYNGSYPFTWQFDDPNRWDTQATDLTSESTPWNFSSSHRDSYVNKDKLSTAAELTVDGTNVMPETKGLTFTASNNSRIMVLPGSFIGLRNGDATLTIPNVPKGMNVVVKAYGYGGQTFSNFTLTDVADATATIENVGSGEVEISLTVTETGDVKLTTDNWCLIKSIAVLKNDITDFSVTRDVRKYDNANYNSRTTSKDDANQINLFSFQYDSENPWLRMQLHLAPGAAGLTSDNAAEYITVKSSKAGVVDVSNVTYKVEGDYIWVYGVKTVTTGSSTLSFTFAGNDLYNGASCETTITLKDQSNQFVEGSQVTPNEIEKADGIRLIYGGFTDYFGKGSSHSYMLNGSQTTDGYDAASGDAASNDGFYYVSGKNNPMKEEKKNCRGWDGANAHTDYLGTNVPVFGTFYQFEPEVDGDLTVDVLQTGCIQDMSIGNGTKTDTYKNLKNYSGGIIDKWDYKALYLTDERGRTVAAKDKKGLSNYYHPYEYELNDDSYDTSKGSKTRTDVRKDLLSLKPYIVGNSFDQDLDGVTVTADAKYAKTLDETTKKIVDSSDKSKGRYAYYFTYGATEDNEGNEITGETTLAVSETDAAETKLKAEIRKGFGMAEDATLDDAAYNTYIGTDKNVHIFENDRHGYWTFTKSHNQYTFPVKAGKTYFLCVDGSKLGLSGFSFKKDETVGSTNLIIEGADNETNKTEVNSVQSNCTVTLIRTITADQPATMMLPFSVSSTMVEDVFGEGTQVLHVKSFKNNRIHFVRHHHQMIVAGEPCIIYPTKTADEWVFKGVTVEKTEDLVNAYEPLNEEGSEFTFIGCFKKETMNAGSYWVSATKGEGQTSGGNDIYIYQTEDEDYMSNTRAFFQNKAGNTNAKLTSAIFDEAIVENALSEATGISIVQASEQKQQRFADGVYTLDGRKLVNGSLPKGIYIKNGRKVIVK